MFRSEYEDLNIDELVEILLENNSEVITQSQLKEMLVEFIYDDQLSTAQDYLDLLGEYSQYYIYNKKYECYDPLDEYDARNIIEKETTFIKDFIDEDITDEDRYEEYLDMLENDRKCEED
jgi:hypothetical protein